MPMSSVFDPKRVLQTLFRLFLISTATLALGACSWFSGDDAESRDAPLLAPLEIPPDLVSPAGDPRLARPVLPTLHKSKSADSKTLAVAPTVNETPSIGEQVLPQGKGVQRMREGQRRWLVVQAEPEQVWPLARGFLEMRGYRIRRDEPAVGLMETDWKVIFADDRADKQSATDKTGQANWRERLRLRIEPAEQTGRTEIFLTQNHSQRVPDATDQQPQWELRPADEDRAVEMLNRLARYLAAENVQDAIPLKPIVASIEVDADNHTVLQIDATFDIAWRRTSLALDGLGFTIEDHDRANRIFHIYNDLPSGLSEEELNYGKPKSATVREEYWVQLQERGDRINLSIRNKAGDVDESQVARHLLNLIMGQFK
jgi:outer membrane protein assembly factor BamC